MDARTDLRLVEIRERTAAAAIGCETIYAFIYRAAQKAAALWRYLTRRHKRRRPRRARASRDAIKDRASIHDRPKTIEGRGEAGHWEGDLIICKRTRPVLVLHERKSRVTLAARLTGNVSREISRSFKPIPGLRQGDREADIVSMAQSITKFARLLCNSSDIVTLVDDGYRAPGSRAASTRQLIHRLSRTEMHRPLDVNSSCSRRSLIGDFAGEPFKRCPAGVSKSIRICASESAPRLII